MKHITTIFTAVLVLIMTSCNNQPKPEAEQTPAADIVKPAEVKPAFTPYKAMLVQASVKDFDKWYVSYKSNDSIRKASGITESVVGRGLNNDKSIIVFNVLSDLQKGKDFAASPGLKERMKKGGVTGTPAISFQDVIRDDTSTIPQKERVMVSHHVKDFDAWLKAYDGEGMATRTSNGMIDRGMMRGVDDPNTVTLLFAITDMDKAKARISSPDLKKIMTDAGVDGAPQITWFKWLN